MKKFIIFILIACFTTCVMGQSKSDKLKNDKKQIEKEINNTQKLLDETKKNKNASLHELSVLRQQISNREALITAMHMLSISPTRTVK